MAAVCRTKIVPFALGPPSCTTSASVHIAGRTSGFCVGVVGFVFIAVMHPGPVINPTVASGGGLASSMPVQIWVMSAVPSGIGTSTGVMPARWKIGTAYALTPLVAAGTAMYGNATRFTVVSDFK